MRLASGVLSVFLGLGFGIPCVFAIRHLSETGEVWMFLGFPTYGGGPFDAIGVPTTVALLVAFLTVCVAQVVVGVLVVTGITWAPMASYLLLPVAMVFWIGFALPVGPLLGVTSAVLLFLSR
jgi:hypothetical protein